MQIPYLVTMFLNLLVQLVLTYLGRLENDPQQSLVLLQQARGLFGDSLEEVDEEHVTPHHAIVLAKHGELLKHHLGKRRDVARVQPTHVLRCAVSRWN